MTDHVRPPGFVLPPKPLRPFALDVTGLLKVVELRGQTEPQQRLMYRSRLQDAALHAAAGAVPNLGAQLFGADDLQQLPVRYPDSPLTTRCRGMFRFTTRSDSGRLVLRGSTPCYPSTPGWRERSKGAP